MRSSSKYKYISQQQQTMRFHDFFFKIFLARAQFSLMRAKNEQTMCFHDFFSNLFGACLHVFFIYSIMILYDFQKINY